VKIASLQPSVSVILERLGRLDLLAACTRYCVDAVPALRERGVTVVRDSWSTTAEELLAAGPDLVIASVPYRNESLAAILKAGCPVLALAPHTLTDIEQEIRLIAAVAEAAERAEAVIAGMRAGIAEVRERAAGIAERPLVYCEEWGKPLIHSQLWVRELVEAAGGVFLGEPGKVTTAEAVAAADPEVVIAAWCGAGDRVPLEKVAARPGWADTRAVRNGRVFCIDDELLNTPAPTLVEGLRAIAAALHPGVFGTALGLRGRTPAGSRVEPVRDASKLLGAMEDTSQNGHPGKSLRFVAAALILRGDEVLICQRKAGTPMGLKWEFPGGKIEAGESAEQALRRELDEELGIQATVGARVAHVRHSYRSGGAVDLQFFAVHSFEGELTNQIFEDMRWSPLKDLPGYDFLAADRDLVRDLAAGKLL
jgi:iron complex transport system substrate-binding protein